MASQTPEAIAKWAEKQAKPTDTAGYHRISAAELNYMRQLRKQNKTQAEIAEQLGRAQSTVSYWLGALEDTTELTTEYLAAKSFDILRNVIENGDTKDHVALLKSSALKEQSYQHITLTIDGIKLPGMGHAEPRMLSPHADVVEGETVQIPQQIAAESDK